MPILAQPSALGFPLLGRFVSEDVQDVSNGAIELLTIERALQGRLPWNDMAIVNGLRVLEDLSWLRTLVKVIEVVVVHNDMVVWIWRHMDLQVQVAPTSYHHSIITMPKALLEYDKSSMFSFSLLNYQSNYLQYLIYFHMASRWNVFHAIVIAIRITPWKLDTFQNTYSHQYTYVVPSGSKWMTLHPRHQVTVW